MGSLVKEFLLLPPGSHHLVGLQVVESTAPLAYADTRSLVQTSRVNVSACALYESEEIKPDYYEEGFSVPDPATEADMCFVSDPANSRKLS